MMVVFCLLDHWPQVRKDEPTGQVGSIVIRLFAAHVSREGCSVDR